MIGGRVGVALVSVAAFAGCQVLFGVELPGEGGGDGSDGNAGAGTDSDTTAGDGGAAGGNATAGAGAIDGGGDAMALLEARSGTRLKAVRYKGADGSEQPTTLWLDTARDEQCSFKVAEDGKLRCLPSTNQSSVFDPDSSVGQDYADSDCTVRIHRRASCDPSRYAATADSICSPGIRIFDRGQSISVYYSKIFSGYPCEGPTAVTPDEIAYIPVEVPPSEFVEAEVVTMP
jgi:hypothetical protein